jgi:hypothetical protein
MFLFITLFFKPNMITDETQTTPASFPIPHVDAIVSVNFSSKHPLTTLLQGMSPILKDCTFNIVKATSDTFSQSKLSNTSLSGDTAKDTFSGIYIEAIDDSMTCVIIGKISADVSMFSTDTEKDNMSFCLSVPTFLTHVKSIDYSACLQLYRISGFSDLYIKTFAPSLGRKTRLMTLQTLNKDAKTFGVKDIDYPYTVEFDLEEFTRIIHFAKSISCKNICFRIFETKNQEKEGTHRSYFTVQINGEFSYDEQCFCSLTNVEVDKQKPSTIIIKNSELNDFDDDPAHVCIDDVEEKFNNFFLVEYLFNFTKAIDRHTVIIRLAQNKPMTLTTCMGDAGSFLTYMLAPNVAADDEEVEGLKCFQPSKKNKKRKVV